MTQPAVFEPARVQILRDAQGGVVYMPGVLSAPRAQQWFEQLRERIDWKSERRPVYGQEVDAPRLIARLRLDDGSELPAPLPEAAALVERLTGEHYNSIGLNYYRDGNDSVAQHNDRLEELVPDHPLALLSLGATRRLTIRAKAPPNRALHVDLESGSLLLMSYSSQLRYLHGIPRSRHALGPRICLAFRMRSPVM